MLTSSSQYFHPDYLQPLPTALDAKNSPLALLAQTCNSIGKDTSSSKNMMPSADKKEKLSEKSLPEPLKQSSPKENKEQDREPFRHSSRPGQIRDVSSMLPSSNDRTTPPRVPTGSPRSFTPASSSNSSPATSLKASPTRQCLPSPVSANRPSSHSSRHESPKSTGISTTAISSPIASSTVSTQSSLKPSSLTNGLPSGSSLPYPLPYTCMGIPHEAALAGSAYNSPLSLHASLSVAAQNSGALKPHASLLPDITYTRVRNSSGTTSLVPVCRDPYCTNCQLTVQNSHLSSSCTLSGCTQCAHEKYLSTLAVGINAHPSGYQNLPGLTGLADSRLSSLHSIYPHGALGAHSGLPYICNWISGGDYCGKRFGTSEELFQHLRTHTSSTDSSAMANYQMSLSHLHSTAGLYPAPGSLSPTSIRKSYPSLGALDLAANRYHPYRHLLSSAAPQPTAQLPQTLAPYYSPYALYGHRLGTTAML